MSSRNEKFVRGVLIGLLLANILAWLAVYDLSRFEKDEVIFFNVGQGDAAFIETKDGKQALIDGGPGSTILQKLAEEMPFWDRTIDLIVLSHPEYDHMSGLIEVLKKYKVENIFTTGLIRDTAEFKEWQRLVKEERADVKISQAGEKIILGDKVFLEVLYPIENLEGTTVKESNDYSLIMKLTCQEKTFLFTGDIYKSGENKILKQGIDVNSDILKVSHHGSKTSSGEEFIKEVSPDIAVISVGKDNKYGHPTQEVLEILENYGIKILRTDLNNDIKILCNSQSLKQK